jgi:hypothetical protein
MRSFLRCFASLFLFTLLLASALRAQTTPLPSAPIPVGDNPANQLALPAPSQQVADSVQPQLTEKQLEQNAEKKAAAGLKKLADSLKTLPNQATEEFMPKVAQEIRPQAIETHPGAAQGQTVPPSRNSKLADLQDKAKTAQNLARKAHGTLDNLTAQHAQETQQDEGSDQVRKTAPLADGLEKAKKAADAADKAEQAAEQAYLIELKKPFLQKTDDDCPSGQFPPIERQAGNLFRPTVHEDFLVLEYNARTLNTRWYDYSKWPTGQPNAIQRNGTFLPVVWTKEKILVHVCGLHFTDIVSVSNASTGLPEGGADIRGGATTTAIPTLAPALDSIQAIGATGQAATIGGLGFGATPALTSAAATGFTNGTLQRGPNGLTYTDSVVSVSPAELALQMYAVIRNGMDLSASIHRDFVLTANPWVYPVPDFQLEPPTSFNHIVLEARQRYDEVSADSNQNGANYANPAAFDQDMTNVQNLSTEMTNFFGALSSQGYGARAVTLWNNYAILRAPLNMMQDHIRKNNCVLSTEAQATQAAADLAAETAVQAVIAEAAALKKLKAAPAGSPDLAGLQTDYDAKHLATRTAEAKLKTAQDAAIDKAGSTTPSSQPVNCDDFETKNYVAFLKEYEEKLIWLAKSDPSTRQAILPWHPVQMFRDLHGLQDKIQDLAFIVGKIYSRVNVWNDAPNAEQSDFITPVAGNALERISIAVQHGYVPFTLASYATSTAPTVTTPAAPTITTAASTSTPTHAVKTILVEVHRRANLNLIGGAMFIRVPTATYAVQAGTTPATVVTPTPTPVLVPGSSGSTNPPLYSYTFTFNGICNGASGVAGTTLAYASSAAGTTTPPATPAVPTVPAYTCVVPTQTGNTQIAGMVGADWFFMGRDYFPLRNGAGFSPHNLIPALYAATSVTSLGNSSFGLNFELFTGVDFLIGAGLAHTTVLPSGVNTSTPLPAGYTLPATTQVNWGPTFGVGFDLGVFSQIFSKGPSGASLP